MSLRGEFVRVDYVSPNRETFKSWSYLGHTWSKENNWTLSIPVDSARACEKARGAFVVHWPTDTETDLAIRISALEKRIEKLEGKKKKDDS